MMIDGIRALDALVATGSVGGAAEALHLTQPAVTRRIQQLETALGTTLLDRRTRPPRLSPAGRNAHRAARRVLESLHQFETSAVDPTSPSGDFRIGIAQGAADMVPGAPFAALRARFPKLRLMVQSGWSPGLLAMLGEGRLDAVVVLLPAGGPPPAWVARRLARQSIVAVAPDAAPLPEALTPADLDGTSWVLNPEGCGYRAALERHLAAGGMALDVAVEVYGPALQVDLVAAGLGLGLMPERLLGRGHLDGVRALRIAGFDLQVDVWLLHSSGLGAFSGVADALASAIEVSLR